MFYRKRSSDSTRGLSYLRRQLSQLMYHNTWLFGLIFGAQEKKSFCNVLSSLQNVYIEVNGHSRLDSLLGGFYTLYASPELRGVGVYVSEWPDLSKPFSLSPAREKRRFRQRRPEEEDRVGNVRAVQVRSNAKKLFDVFLL